MASIEKLPSKVLCTIADMLEVSSRKHLCLASSELNTKIFLASAAPIEKCPNEVLNMIVDLLDAPSHKRLRMTSKFLNTSIHRGMKMSYYEWTSFHGDYEKDARSKRQRLSHLACGDCVRVVERRLFSDSMKGEVAISWRFCIPCGITSGRYASQYFQVSGVKSFACAGCLEPKPLHKESKCYESTLPRINIFQDGDQQQYISRKDRRWCQKCWSTITNYAKYHSPNAQWHADAV
ncbi:hypothetical protein MMC28_006638 [Mycoblastus sanguinarius]|nr:hypothetical protein [Mycoblastus sanguinarius]